MITAKFGNKTFEVSNKKIMTLDGFSMSESLNTEETEVDGKKPNLNIKGISLKEMNFDVKLDGRFVNVETEIKAWKNIMFSKKSSVFYLGKNVVGRFFLTSVQEDEIILSKSGAYSKTKITLGFKEDGKHAIDEFAPPDKAQNVISSASKNKKIKVGTMIKPKSGTRWYYTAVGAINRTGKSGKAYNKKMKVTYIYQNGKAINPQGLGWMLPKDVDVY